MSEHPLYLYNTMHREKMEFFPLSDGKQVGLYACGPTVYSYAHIGNLRAYVFEDVLKRTLLYNGFEVKHVINITDVGHLTDDADQGEDKMERSAAREGKTAWDIAAKYTKAFQNDIRELDIIPPDVWCKATDHIKEQIDLVKRLEEKGFTYRAKDGIYYDSAKFPDYGKLARLDVEGLEAGRRVELAKDKRNITDFALWKFSPADKKRQMEWESPWGTGFPGWHVECSAMSMRYLGEQFDIHCGGIDHVPVHHTNEIAQVEAVTKKQWVRFWMHGEFLLIPKKGTEEAKMAKSKGDILTLQVLKNSGYHPLAYRYFLLNAHYRKQLLFRDDVMKSAQNGFDNFCARVAALKEKGKDEDKQSEKAYRRAFIEAINDDLNTPQALAVAWEVLHDKKLAPATALKLIEDFDRILGLGTNVQERKQEQAPAELLQKLEERRQARAEKNWALADRMRDEIKAAGYEILDTKEGAKLKKI